MRDEARTATGPAAGIGANNPHHLPSTSKSTSVCGSSPARSRIAAGMVTCPLDVIRICQFLP
jgi:hypothetical protein